MSKTQEALCTFAALAEGLRSEHWQRPSEIKIASYCHLAREAHAENIAAEIALPPRARPDVIEALRGLLYKSESDNAYLAPYVAGHNDAIRAVLRILEGV